jgi:hypothetical protein
MASPSGAAQRLNSSTSTRFGATYTTNSGRSTEAGTDTGPTMTPELTDAPPAELAVLARV